MHNFLKKSTKLRLEVINYITDYLKQVNRDIVAPRGLLTYVDWDYSRQSDEDEITALVPEIEITAICLSRDRGELCFVNAMGEDVRQGSLDTEELIYVADFIDTLKSAPENQ